MRTLRNREHEAAIASLYDPRLPYHNFAHAKRALRAGQRILWRCREAGIAVQAKVVYYALLLHDAGYAEDPATHGCATREDWAIALARRFLAERGFPADFVDAVARAIAATHRDAEFSETEQKVVRAADLAGLAAGYARFRHDGELLRREYELLSGERVSWDEWVPRAVAALQLYLRQRIVLTRFYYDAAGRSAFHARAQRNLARLCAEVGLALPEAVPEAAAAPARSAVV